MDCNPQHKTISLDDFVTSTTQNRTDYNDYDPHLTDEIDTRMINDGWIENTRQPYYVVNTAERALAKTYPPDIGDRHTAVQAALADEVGIKKQTVQAACHLNLLERFETPPTDPQGRKLWHELFDRVLRDIERTRRADLPR
jgi:hypothetical protein